MENIYKYYTIEQLEKELSIALNEKQSSKQFYVYRVREEKMIESDLVNWIPSGVPNENLIIDLIGNKVIAKEWLYLEELTNDEHQEMKRKYSIVSIYQIDSLISFIEKGIEYLKSK